MSELINTGFDLPDAIYAPPGDEENSAPNLITDPGLTVAVNPDPSPAEKGPSTAAVSGLTPEGRNAAKALLPVPFPEHFGAPQMAALARDLAMDIQTVDVVLKKHGLNDAQYGYLSQHNEFFRNTLAQQAREWQGVGSTQDRLKAQAAAALEAQLPTLASRMGAQSEKLADAVEAAKLFAKVAGVDADTRGARSGGEGFTISIDLGADTRLTIGPGASPAHGQTTPVLREVRAISQGET